MFIVNLAVSEVDAWNVGHEPVLPVCLFDHSSIVPHVHPNLFSWRKIHLEELAILWAVVGEA